MISNLVDVYIDNLNNIDNQDWIEKVVCWKKRENEFNIYIFLIVVNNAMELEKYYETITSSIAVDFQSQLSKAVERWNIYMVFESEEKINWDIKAKVEQDKFSTRKMVWDELNSEQICNKEYLYKRLFGLEIQKKRDEPNEKSLNDIIREKNLGLFQILENDKLDVVQRIAMYMGDDGDEQKN